MNIKTNNQNTSDTKRQVIIILNTTSMHNQADIMPCPILKGIFVKITWHGGK